MRFFVATIALSCLVGTALAQGHGCEANIPDNLKQDCFPEPDATEEACRARDCVWCPQGEHGGDVPWCFNYNAEATTPMPGFGCDDGYIPDDERVDCAPGEPTDEFDCRFRNCTWCPAEEGGTVPWCYIPGVSSSSGYVMVGERVEIPNGVRVNLAKAVANETHSFGSSLMTSRPMAWEGEAELLTLDAEFQSDYRLRIKIYNSTQRFEVPLQIKPASGGNNNLLYDIEFSNDPLFSFRVVRKSTGHVLFESSPDRFTYANQYLSMSWKVGQNDDVYGLGENEQRSFRHDFTQNITWAMWARDQPPDFTANMYGVQPYMTVLEEDGNAHSVAVINSNAQQFTMQDGKVIRYITIGGILDFYFFLGPEPETVVQQYTEAVGRAQMPPYWGLGFQLCRYGYNSLENMKEVVDRTTAAGIPHDVQYGDIDIMHKELDFTYSRERFGGLPEYIKELKERGIKFVTILDPFISIEEDPEEYRPFKLGQEMDVWVKRTDGTPVVGRVWPDNARAQVYFPDYSKNSTREWWRILIREFHDLLEYDGLWIDMNEPANFEDGDMIEGCASNNLNNPPFLPKIIDQLHSKTICPDHVQEAGLHYDVHSLYGWFQSEPTLQGAREGTGKRALVLSRSTFLGSGHWVAHWLGDNWSKWDNLHYSIIGMLQYNQFGVPFVGSDICGFIFDSNAALCQRWMELGAFYPFSRNHNGLGYIDQDPASWGAEIAESSRQALLVRYTLLPYLYTLFFYSVTRGDTVARALWHEFPTDPKARGIDRQFMWGSGLLITPVLDEGHTSVEGYFPNARFYDYFTGAEVETKGDTVTLDTPLDKINLHLRGGVIIPTQEPAVNTMLSRQNPLGLIVSFDENGEAVGDLFYDDGDKQDTIEGGEYFHARFTLGDNGTTMWSRIIESRFQGISLLKLQHVRVLGHPTGITWVQVNGVGHGNFRTEPSGEVVIEGLNLSIGFPFTIQWGFPDKKVDA